MQDITQNILDKYLKCTVRTILALGYRVLPNIFQYWVVLGIGQYFYWLSYPIPILNLKRTSFLAAGAQCDILLR